MFLQAQNQKLKKETQRTEKRPCLWGRPASQRILQCCPTVVFSWIQIQSQNLLQQTNKQTPNKRKLLEHPNLKPQEAKESSSSSSSSSSEEKTPEIQRTKPKKPTISTQTWKKRKPKHHKSTFFLFFLFISECGSQD